MADFPLQLFFSLPCPFTYFSLPGSHFELWVIANNVLLNTFAHKFFFQLNPMNIVGLKIGYRLAELKIISLREGRLIKQMKFLSLTYKITLLSVITVSNC